MKKTEEIKKEAEQLEKTIKLMLSQFIERNGTCEIRIDVSQDFIVLPGIDKKEPTDLNVNVILTI